MKFFTRPNVFKFLSILLICICCCRINAQNITIDKTSVDIHGCHQGLDNHSYTLAVGRNDYITDLNIIMPPNSSISLDGRNWKSSIHPYFDPGAPKITGFTYHIRIDSTAPAGAFSGDIVILSSGQETKFVQLTGQVDQAPDLIINSITPITSASTSFRASFNASIFAGLYDFSCPPLNLHVNNSVVSNPIVVPINVLKPANYSINYKFVAGGCISTGGAVNLQVTQALNNADLSNLVCDPALSTAFNPSVTDYTVDIPNTQTSIDITPTSADANSKIAYNVSEIASGSKTTISGLNVGENYIAIYVYNFDFTTHKIYNIQVNRAKSSNADLAQLDVKFGSKVFGYGPVAIQNSLSVVNSTRSVIITPLPASNVATVKVNNTAVTNGSASEPINLNASVNTIETIVTAEDGTTKKYTLYITRSSDNSLTLSGYKGTLVTINAPGTSGVPAGSTPVDFTGTTAVMIGGAPAAAFAVLAPDRIDAIIGDSPSGDIVVTTPTGTVTPAKFVLLSSLPVNFVYLKSKVVTDGVSLEWMVADAWDTKEFIVERSSDGINFTAIGKVSANKTVSTYAYTDLNAGGKTGYYRVKSVSLSSGHSIYSTIVKNNVEGNKTIFSVYPNPVTGKVLTVSVFNLKAGLYNLILTTSTGVEILHKQLTVSTGTTTYNISLPAAVPNGVYTISLKGNDVFNTKQIVVNNK